MFSWNGIFYFYDPIDPKIVRGAMENKTSFPINIIGRQKGQGRPEELGKVINVFPYEISEEEWGVKFEGDVDDPKILGVQGGAFHVRRKENHMLSLGETPFLHWQPRRTF